MNKSGIKNIIENKGKLVINELVQKQNEKQKRENLRTLGGVGLPRLGLNGIGFNNPIRGIDHAQGQLNRTNLRPMNVNLETLLKNGASQMKELQGELKELEAYKSSLENKVIELNSIKGDLKEENVKVKQEVVQLNKENNDWVNYGNHTEGLIGYLEAENVNFKQELAALNQDIAEKDQEIEEKNQEINELADLIESDYTVFARMVRPALAITGGIVSSYLAYQNPAMVLDVLNGVDSKMILSTAMPYLAELGAVGGAILGYATSSLLGPVALFGIMKFVQAIDSTVRNVLNTVITTTFSLTEWVVTNVVQLSVELVRSVVQFLIGTLTTLYSVASVAYEYRGTIGTLILAALLAYYNPDQAMSLLQSVKAMVPANLMG